MQRPKANKKTLIRWKIYIDRARMYIGYIQFFMIGFVFLDSFRDNQVGELIYNHLYISIPILFLLFIVFSLLLGRIDTVLGLREEELRNSTQSNPVMREILEGIEEMKKEVSELKQQLYNQTNNNSR
ncbi:hypothetical protein [Carboxylicivirga linearis]|uniref:Uncharacterized protein n=1 Tax=Carboxylicivirga linearis TaxID=1628157 RepID=A0ABS5JP60_9BACT|nr:hypothetical protein [Carboxylicivirga linearis]MBS2096694.1 hypothetical protein [Carboxylicivirga linearis]